MADRQLKELGTAERAALLALLAQARPVTNAVLKEASGVELTGAPRRKLAELKLITSEQTGPNRSFVHELTDAGWRRCQEELQAAPPAGVTSYVKALYSVLRRIGAHLDRNGIPLAEVFGDIDAADDGPTNAPGAGPAVLVTPEDVETRVRTAYSRLAPGPNEWVSLVSLRTELADLSHDAVDQALIRLEGRAAADLMANENRKALTAADRAAAVRIGGKDRHMLAMAD